MFRTLSGGMLLVALFVAAGQTPRTHPDYVPDAKTAVRIAEAVLIARFGEERVKAELPLEASNHFDKQWLVSGTLPGPIRLGGGMTVIINKYDGCISNIMERSK